MAAEGSARDRRRPKAALFLFVCGWAGIAPHWLDPQRAFLPAITLALMLGGYGLRTVFHGPRRHQATNPEGAAGEPASALQEGSPGSGGWAPPVDVVVAARDEEAVVGRLVERLAALHWPDDRLRLWVIDDGSEDRTPQLLAELQGRIPQLNVLRRSRDAGGGKSAALNMALTRLRAPWMLVLDADADLQADTLERLIPYAERGGWAAVQLRKAVVNSGANLLTRAQAMEMVLDAEVQQGRLAAGGVAELRGNGQLLRREAVFAAGGFNEATVTDDLDLTFRFLLAGQPIGLLWNPPVREEAVLSLRALWRQRQRWAEGGLQRFLDYWPQLLGRSLSRRQRIDLACFFLLQYALPVTSAADLIGSLATRTPPAYWPLSIVGVGLSGAAIVRGCRRPAEGPPLPDAHALGLALGLLYLMHWFVVIPWVTLRMALLPKRLVWAKTLHLGDHPAAPERDTRDGEGEPELTAEAGQV
jgi:1,2-diacylglycerol 3-beta-glucosyltransferase